MVSDASSMPRELDLAPQTEDELCSDVTVRFLLTYLVEAGQPVSVKNLACHLAAHKHDTSPECISPAQQRRALAQLRHRYLPRLRKTPVLTYDDQRKVVAATPAAWSLVDVAAGEPSSMPSMN